MRLVRVRAISWVGVKTDSYREMREFFSGVAGLPVDFESTDFTVFRFPSGDSWKYLVLLRHIRQSSSRITTWWPASSLRTSTRPSGNSVLLALSFSASVEKAETAISGSISVLLMARYSSW